LPLRVVERVFGQTVLADRVFEDVVEDASAAAEVVRGCKRSIE
jgi:hypothetical protein